MLSACRWDVCAAAGFPGGNRISESVRIVPDCNAGRLFLPRKPTGEERSTGAGQRRCL